MVFKNIGGVAMSDHDFFDKEFDFDKCEEIERSRPPRKKRSFFRENGVLLIVLIHLITFSIIFFFASGGQPIEFTKQLLRGIVYKMDGPPPAKQKSVAPVRRKAPAQQLQPAKRVEPARPAPEPVVVEEYEVVYKDEDETWRNMKTERPAGGPGFYQDADGTWKNY